jgi:hypothetical protein
VDPEEGKDEKEFQNAKRALKAVYGHSDSESSDNERHKALHVMFGGSWDITFRRVIKTLRREVAAAAPAHRVALHQSGWRRESVSMPLIVPRAWQTPCSSRCLSPQPSSTSSCTTS